MPEAPDLEVIKDLLNQRVRDLVVEQARVLKPLELRTMTPADFTQDVVGRSFMDFSRRGKFLIMELSAERMLLVNPMLTGAIQLCAPSTRRATSPPKPMCSALRKYTALGCAPSPSKLTRPTSTSRMLGEARWEIAFLPFGKPMDLRKSFPVPKGNNASDAPELMGLPSSKNPFTTS